jgi:hypothetical protein
MKHYRYEGAVMSFNNVVANKWCDETYADSPKKARSNLCYHYKKQNGLFKAAKITLVGTVIEVA